MKSKKLLATASSKKELHSFVRLSIVYLGIVAGLAVLALVFYEIGSRDGLAISSVRPFFPSDVYAISIAFFYTVIAFSSIGLIALAKNLRIGAYLAFIVLILSLFAPYDKQTGTAPFTIIWWFAIPNIVVGVLLVNAFKTLSPVTAAVVMGRQHK